LKRAGKILFVLDASNLKAEPARVAQQLYDILTRAYVSEAAVPVVVACNKRDDPTSVTPEQARSILQTELYVHIFYPFTSLFRFNAALSTFPANHVFCLN
jgi:signal recognition particle receptor subunit beta